MTAQDREEENNGRWYNMCAACECTYGLPQPNCGDDECGTVETGS